MPVVSASGFLAFTDAVWRKEDPPPEVKTSFEQEYPTMGTADNVRRSNRK
jgi:hypothetical protein